MSQEGCMLGAGSAPPGRRLPTAAVDLRDALPRLLPQPLHPLELHVSITNALTQGKAENRQNAGCAMLSTASNPATACTVTIWRS